MPASNNNTNSTTVFKADISQFKAAIQEANRIIRVANSEFKATSASMDDWSQSTDGLSAKIQQSQTVFDAQKRKLEVLEEQYRECAKTQDENSNGMLDLKARINNQRAAMEKSRREVEKYKTQLKNLETDTKSLTKQTEQQEKELKSLKQKYVDSVAATGKSSKASKELASQIKKLDSELKENKGKLRKAAEAADELDSSYKNVKKSGGEAGGAAGGKIASGFTTLKGALANLVADGIEKAIDGFNELITFSDKAKKAANEFAGKTGTAQADMKQYAESIKNVYANNFGEDLSDVSDVMATVNQLLDETDSSKLEKLTERAILLRDSFDFDPEETLRTVQQIVQQWGISTEEAFNLIVQGAQNGLNKNGNLLDTINEYGPKFKKLGMSAQETFNMLSNGAKSGAFDVDKLGDSINELTIRLQDGTADEQLEKMGFNAADVAKKIGAGGDSAKQVYLDIMNTLSNMSDPIEQNAAGVALMGSMWEDTGGKSLMAMKDITGEIDKQKNAIEELNSTQYNYLGATIEGIKRDFMTNLSGSMDDLNSYLAENADEIKAELKPVAEDVGKIISAIVKSLPGLLKSMKPLLDYIVMILDFLAEHEEVIEFCFTALSFLITLSWKLIGLLFSLGGKAIPEVNNGIAAFAQMVDEGATKAFGKFGEFADGVKNKFNTTKDNLKQLGGDIVSDFMAIPQNFYNFGRQSVEQLWQGVVDVKDWFIQKVSGFWDEVKSFLHIDAIQGAISSVTGKASGFFGNSSTRTYNTYNTYNQTNNSPKALSRLEIYRQTNNQLKHAF